jgi:DUF1365 family protein
MTVGPDMAPAAVTGARLYRGHVMHLRLQPKRHQFRYRVFSVMVDLDRMHEQVGRLRWLRLNRGGLMSVHEADHGLRNGSPLRPWLDAELVRAGRPPAARVDLLCFPRMLGFVFNPLSAYFCHDVNGELQTIVYEVKNTFGDQVAYVLPAGPDVGGLYQQQQVKQMFVSPFIDMAQTYRFAVRAPGDRLALRIRQGGASGEVLIAAHTAEAEPLTDRALARAFVAHPLMTLRVIALIHWHALRLFLKGVPFLRYSKLAGQGGTDQGSAAASQAVS